MKHILISTFMLSAGLFAQDIVLKQKQPSLDITIYNNNLGFVKQTKKFTIPSQNYFNLVYEGVPNSIIIDSVIPKFSNPKTTLYSQNFEQNSVDYKTILQYYKKNNLSVNYYAPTTNTNKKSIQKGKIVSNIQNIMTIQNSNGKVQSINIADIYFDKLPQKLQRTKPSLSWRVFSPKGTQSVELKYLMNNISWKANYTLDLDKPYANLKGWITINNNTGIEFENANIYCLAGAVNKVTPKPYPRMAKNMMLKTEVVMDAMPVEVKQQSLSGYHLYTIPFKETISKGSKQINFIQKPNVKYTQIASITTSMPSYAMRNERKLTFDHIIQIKNKKSNGLGLALPKGVVRVFSKDSDNKTHFIGENRIPHTANKDDIKIKIGKFFDIKAKIKQTKFKTRKDYIYSEILTTITNEDKQTRTIHIDQSHNAYGDYTLNSTCSGICKEQKLSASKTRYIITLKPKQKYEFKTTYELD